MNWAWIWGRGTLTSSVLRRAAGATRAAKYELLLRPSAQNPRPSAKQRKVGQKLRVLRDHRCPVQVWPPLDLSWTYLTSYLSDTVARLPGAMMQLRTMILGEGV